MVGHGEKRLLPGRLGPVRQSTEAIPLAEQRRKQPASRKGREIQPEPWEYVKDVHGGPHGFVTPSYGG